MNSISNYASCASLSSCVCFLFYRHCPSADLREKVIEEHPSTCCIGITILYIMLLYFLIVTEVSARAALCWKDAQASFKSTLTAAAAAQWHQL